MEKYYMIGKEVDLSTIRSEDTPTEPLVPAVAAQKPIPLIPQIALAKMVVEKITRDNAEQLTAADLQGKKCCAAPLCA